MSNDLKKRLRRRWPNEDLKTQAEKREAADRIEELEAKLSKSEALLAKAVEALSKIATDGDPFGWIAINTLAELKEEDRG